MKRYNPKEIEPKWQAKWAADKVYEADDNSTKPKRYIMEYFPYPSGAAMHVGHVRNYTIGDALSRHARMNGYNVMHPMGWDAFGLPAENYAIKTGISPQEAITQNTARFKQQLMQMGFGYDWSREFWSSDPSYYHWTQWFFLLLYKRGLAYRKESPQWWCPVDKTVLANEQVENGRCWRCGSEVEKKNLNQWFFKITDYADRLEKDLQNLDWSNSIKAMQRNWIGRKTGINITYNVSNTKADEQITVFTTRPDTNFGATFIVLAPEHPFVQKVMSQEVVPNDGQSHWQAVEHYVQKALSKSEIERKEEGRLKTGAFTGLYVVNPLNDRKLPIWVSDFVLAGFGTGAVVGVPAHDLRDYEFAKQFDLPIAHVVTPEFVDTQAPPKEGVEFKERVAVQAIVKHPTEDSYLLLRMKGWDKEVYGYPTGGIEEGETPADTARRELEEETGFHNIKGIKPVGEPYYARFYHDFKKVNRRVKMYTVEITLQDLDRRAVSEEEQAINEIQWTPAKEVAEKVLGDGCKRIFNVYQDGGELGFAGEESGIMINSGPLDGLDIHEAIEKMKDLMEANGMGKRTVSYSIRDWLISRQRYWGAPIPMIHCPKDGIVPVPEDQLPVVLPELESYEPSGDGRSPLARVPEFVNTTCPKCGGPAERETDTMDGFACSSWYFLRFADPHNDKVPFDAEKVKRWLPVDDYIGGAEHAVMHLLYARMWTKVMFDAGMIEFDEPFKTLRNQGMILAPDGQKMSKSKGNTIEPDVLINEGYGADSIRIMELFIGPWNQSANWSVEGMGGSFRFLQRIWTMVQEFQAAAKSGEQQSSDDRLAKITHRTIKKVGSDLEDLGFNTAVAAMMEMVNELYKIKAEDHFSNQKNWRFALESLLQLLAPFAPHITEELWSQMGHSDSVHTSKWPEYDEQYLVSETMTIVVQVNGKVRAQLELPVGTDETAVKEAALKDEKIAERLAGKNPKKVIYVPNKLVSIVI
jgi:leucyl-tRNA synthetase